MQSYIVQRVEVCFAREILGTGLGCNMTPLPCLALTTPLYTCIQWHCHDPCLCLLYPESWHNLDPGAAATCYIHQPVASLHCSLSLSMLQNRPRPHWKYHSSVPVPPRQTQYHDSRLHPVDCDSCMKQRETWADAKNEWEVQVNGETHNYDHLMSRRE